MELPRIQWNICHNYWPYWHVNKHTDIILKIIYNDLALFQDRQILDDPIFLTIQLETFNNNFEKQKDIIEGILPYTDYIAISTYPFGNFGDPGDIPDDWFSRLYNMAPEKPVAIAETAFLAEDLTLKMAIP